MGDQRYGITELYAPLEGQKIEAQYVSSFRIGPGEIRSQREIILFVHGLFGHPLNTWTAKASDPLKEPICWPRTVLPPVIPNTKIFSYGYDANVDGFLSSAGQNTIHQNAQNLLSDLADLRSSPSQQEIPLIFVAHSLGGIVVKDALNQSSSMFESRLKAIAPATVGVCFLGTPHRGSKSASLGRMAYNCTVIFTKRPNHRLLQGLERQSETLDRIGDDFLQTLLKHNISIRSFREEKETRKYILFSIMVVEADSAKIGNEKEEVGSIPADHSNMTKFEDSNDIGFRRVSSQLQRWVEGVARDDEGLDQQCQNLLNSLDDTATRARIGQVQHAHQQTFQWVFDPDVVPFNDWLRSTEPGASPIYWIQGKPGSGKSTLMKYALKDDRLLQSLSAGSDSTWIVAAFFFHDRGSELQKSLTGMIQQILKSILRQVPELTRFALPIYQDMVRAQKTENPTWDLESLEVAILSIFRQREVSLHMFLMLDALDEHHGDNDVLAALLKRMVENAASGHVWLKLCLASRSWTVFKQHFGRCPGFAIHDHTQRDIRTYIEARLNICEEVPQRTDGQIHLRRLVDHVADKAFGVFIWVRLVMDLISKGARDGTPYPVLEEMASKMPQELKALYADTLRRVEPEYSVEAYRMLQITLCRLVPLSTEDFLHINLLNAGFYPSHNSPNSKASPDAILESSTTLSNWIASRSGGLLEVSGRLDDDDVLQAGNSELNRNPDSTIQFIHQTVKKYIQVSGPRNGLINIPEDKLDLKCIDGSRCMLRSCGLRESTSHRIKKDVFMYANRTKRRLKQDIDLVRGAFVSYPAENSSDRNVGGASDVRGNMNWFIKDCQGRFYDALRSLGNCEEAFVKLSAFEGLDGNCFSSRIEKYPGVWHVSLVRSLASQESEGFVDPTYAQRRGIDQVQDSWILTAITTLIPVDPALGITDLGACLLAEAINEKQRYRCVGVVLRAGAEPNVPIQPDDIFSLSPLSICVCQHGVSLVRLLLKHGAKMSRDWDVLRLAAIRGDPNITQALLDAGFENLSPRDQSHPEDQVFRHLVEPALVSAAPAGRTINLARVQASRTEGKSR